MCMLPLVAQTLYLGAFVGFFIDSMLDRASKKTLEQCESSLRNFKLLFNVK